MPTDGFIEEEEEDQEMKLKMTKFKKRHEIQIKSLKMLMTRKYDKLLILTSIVYILVVFVYVLIGPEFFNL